MEEVTVEVPCWKLAVVLNDQLVFQGDNPLGFEGLYFVPVFWNYQPHINYYDTQSTFPHPYNARPTVLVQLQGH